MRVGIHKIIKITPGRFHCWCESDVGRIKKENKNVPEHLWDIFEGKEPKKALELKWYQRFWRWLIKLFRRWQKEKS